MMKKLLITFLIFLSSYTAYNQNVTLITTSVNAAWSPTNVNKSGAILTWTAADNGVFPGQVINANDPTFDFSSNDGTPINITVTSGDGFANLTRLDLWTLDLTSLDVTNATGLTRLEPRDNSLTTLDVTQNTALTRLDVRFNNITTLDVSQNTAVTRLVVRGNSALPTLDVSNNVLLSYLHIGATLISTIDLSTNTSLDFFRGELTQLTALDISNNPLFDFVKVNSSQLTSGQLDQIINDLDGFGVSDGNLQIRNNPESITAAAQPGYDNLIARGWTIDVVAPPVPSVETIVMTTTSTSNAWSPSQIINSGSTLKWTVTGGVTIPEVEIDDPTFDLSGNTGVATITITSDFGFFGLTRLNLWNDNGVGSELTTLDATNAADLDRLDIRVNSISTLDVSQNPLLDRLVVRSNPISAIDVSSNTELTNLQAYSTQLAALDLSNNPLLDFLRINSTLLTALDLSNNPLLEFVKVNSAQLSSGELDQIVNDLDTHGLSDGNLEIRNNTGSLTAASQPSYDNLIAKGWSIDVVAPPVPSVETIVMTTTSTSNAWSPLEVINSGSTLKWTVTGGITIPEVEIDDPTFDLSGNTGVATITITSDFGFFGLTRLNLWNDNGVGSGLTTLDATSGADLDRLDIRINSISTLDVSQNILLDRLIVRSNPISTIDVSNNTQLSYLQAYSTQLSALDLSNNTLLDYLRINSTLLTALDLSNNPLLDYVKVNSSQLTSGELDQIVNDLDTHGVTDGNLEIRNNPGSLTAAAQPGYDNLIAKGWTIDVVAPPVPSVETIVMTTTSTSNAWSPSQIINSGQTLKWTVSGGVSIPEVEIDDPTFDLSGNTGVATITITSDFGFFGLTRLNLWNDNGVGSELTTLDATNGTDLDRLDIRVNSISTIDVSQNTLLDRLIVRSNPISAIDVSNNIQLTYLQAYSTQLSALDLSNNPLLEYLRINTTQLTTLDLSNNSLLDFVKVNESLLTSIAMDQIINDLDTHGVTDGNLEIRNNPGALSLASQPGYDNLIAKGWTIDVAAPGPIINVLGNGVSIANGDATPDPNDDTDFGLVSLNTPKTNTFTIQNDGVADLIISDIDFIFGSSTTFTFENMPTLPATIIPGGSTTFDVRFVPTATTVYFANIQIDHNDDAQNPFQYSIQGEGSDNIGNGEIMITQYYNGFSVNNKWIEIKNISGSVINAGTYYLAMYDETDIPSIATSAPTESIAIPLMQADEVLLFKNPSGPALPSAGNLGLATQIFTTVCTFDNGDDVILISTSNDTSSYGNRQDIIGTIDGSSWGDDSSYIKGGCASEAPHIDYIEADWIRVLLDDVDAADPDRNVALGTQVIGPTEFDGSTWSNLEPDQSREVVLTQSFSNANQTIVACNITINNGVNIVFDSNGATKNSIVDYGDLIVNGSLVIGDTESLVTYDANASLGTITKNESSTLLNRKDDVTYWSAPVQGAQISTVFAGVPPSRIFELKPADVNPIWAGEPYEHWFVATGAMSEARGYSAEGIAAGIHSITFTGVPNNGNYARDLFYDPLGSPEDNFNFIGNPYPTSIDIEQFLQFNNLAAIFLWTHATENPGGEYDPADYVTYSLAGGSSPGVTKNIGSSQGFMVESLQSGSVLFNNSFKLIDQNDQFYKTGLDKNIVNITSDDHDKIWLELTDDNGVKDDILLAFLNETTDGLDKRYDVGYVNYSKNVNLYSQLDDQKMVIQAMSELNRNKSVTLGIDTKIATNLTLGISATAGILKDVDVYLVDKLLNVTHDLKLSDYSFNQAAIGKFPNRFSLQFNASGSILADDEMIGIDDFIISSEFEELKVISSKNVKSIHVYDMLGRKLIVKDPNAKTFEMSTHSILSGTILLIQATLENGSVVNRKTIKN